MCCYMKYHILGISKYLDIFVSVPLDRRRVLSPCNYYYYNGEYLRDYHLQLIKKIKQILVGRLAMHSLINV